MKILMLAPEPFFQPRGTPISIYFRLKTLADLGHEVDLITYHLGEDKQFNNLRIFRIPDILGIKKIKIGPSFAKIPMDILLLLKTFWRLIIDQYDLIFSHEEAAFFGTFLSKIRRVPHLYDMHSSLPQQLSNFNFTKSKIIHAIFNGLERFVLKNSRSILVICPDLQKIVKEEGYEDKSILLENFIDFESAPFSPEEITKIREQFAAKDEKIVLYAGNFQPYQGVELLLEAAARIKETRVKFLLVGETPTGVERMKQKASELGILQKVHFTGQVPPSKVPLYISLGDALVSPRISGTNTPLKIYSFLKSGKPVIATKLWTHTQVLNDSISILVEPNPESLANGILNSLFTEAGQKIGCAAKQFAEIEYTYPRYKEKLSRALVLANTRKKK